MPIRAIFILRCGCDDKNLGPAMLVFPIITSELSLETSVASTMK